MPLIAVPEGILQQLPQKPQVEVIDGSLTVEWSHKRVELSPRRLIFSEGVVARYDGTVCKAKTLVLYLENSEGYGVAEGGVQIVDPDGTLNASKFVFDWRKRTGSATDVSGRSYRFSISGREATVEGNRWALTDAVFSPCAETPPLLQVRATSVEILDGKRGVAKHASLYVKGRRVLTLPTYRFNLGPKTEGLALPTVSMNRDGTVGASWASSLGVGKNLGLSASVQAFPKRPLGGALELGYSPRNYRLPISTFSERNPYGFLDNVNNSSLRTEFDQTSSPYFGFTVGGALNQGIAGRLTRDTLTAPIELGAGTAGQSNGMGYAVQGRFQRIGLTGGPHLSRFAVGTTLISVNRIASKTDSFFRVDAESYLQPQADYAWASGTLGFSSQAAKTLRISASYMRAVESGSAFLQTDRPFVNESINSRIDLLGSATKISFLSKFDPKRGRFYDHEIMFKQATGCLEPYIVWRKFPSSLNFGVRLRTDDLFEAIDRRLKRR